MAYPAFAALSMEASQGTYFPRCDVLTAAPQVRLASLSHKASQTASLNCATDAPAWFSAPEADRWAGLGTRRKPAFLATRAVLRGLLADAAGGAPEQWLLDGRGRPLDPACGLQTSISHHADHIAVAVYGGAADGLGIDLERPRAGVQRERIAHRWFSVAEQSLLAENEPEQACALFYRLWTLKEAWVKATGRGLAGNFQAMSAEKNTSQGWRLVADTEAIGWQAWSGCIDGDWLAVIWRSRERTSPEITTVTLASSYRGVISALEPTASLHLPVEPGL